MHALALGVNAFKYFGTLLSLFISISHILSLAFSLVRDFSLVRVDLLLNA